jgi:small subunit ribosomal protein S6
MRYDKLLPWNPCSALIVAGPFSPEGGEGRMMNKYESVFIINFEIGEENTKALVEKFKNLLESSAQLESIDEWGKRRLAYPINDKNEGYYVLANFSAEPEFPRELERIYKITDGIIKYMIIKKDN